MAQDFLSQAEVDALLKGVTSEATEDDWAAAMAEVGDFPSDVGNSDSLAKIIDWLRFEIAQARTQEECARSRRMIAEDVCQRLISLGQEVK